MAFDLLTPVHNQLPNFQPNQVLTYNHLNQVVDYLYQQERYTRNKLIGNGIVCGLSFQWQTLAAPNAQVIIEDGLANTSAGYLLIFQQPRALNGAIIPYTHRRNFDRLNKFVPFDDPAVYTNQTILELITLDEFNADTVSLSKQTLKEVDRTNTVLVLLFDPEVKDVAKCLDESCDDKGKIYLFTPRPLLIPIAVLDNILNATNAKKYWTEEGRGWKSINSRLQGVDLDYANVPNLFTSSELQSINTPALLQTHFKNKIQGAALDPIRNRINALLNAFPWMFTAAIEALRLVEMPALTLPPAANLGDQFRTKAIGFRDTFDPNYIQYLYDFIRDVTDAYNELYVEATSLVSECGGNEWRNPFHIMLGKAQPNPDSLKAYEESKYLLPAPLNFKYRHYFIPSPVMDEQFMLYEKVQQLFKRLARLINNFGININDNTIKISPSRDYDNDLGIRAIPYYYSLTGTPLIQNVWNYQSTWRNKVARHRGYHTHDQPTLLSNDTAKNDFYRIEGHINKAIVVALADIDILREQFNLPFGTATVSVQKSGSSMQVTCSFPDLEEDFNYYRDRVLGYMREWLYQLDGLPSSPFFNSIRSQIMKMIEILTSVRCIENFAYDKYKETYKGIFEILLDVYAKTIKSNINNANQQFNTFSNIINIIFFCPIYKIWYAYKYRLNLITAAEIDSLTAVYNKYSGLEHLAGVRRGETFLMVYDAATNNVIADFNVPDLLGCGCECRADACEEKNGKPGTGISPLQKPVIMVVDFASKKTRDKNKAFWVPSSGTYRLELDSMGFYKGDSEIAEVIAIYEDPGYSKPSDLLEGLWLDAANEGQVFQLNYRFRDNPPYGIHKLYYEMKGDFDEGLVRGMIILVLIGKITFEDNFKIDVNIGLKPKPEYPYEPDEYKKQKVDLKFTDNYKKKVIDHREIPVYTTPLGNEVGIFTDKKGYSYFKAITVKKAEIDEIGYLIETDGGSQPGVLTMNVIDRASRPNTTKYNGRVLKEDGSPVEDAKVRIGRREVVTNDKGEFTLSNLNPGDAIEIEKEGYKKRLIQVNANMSAETKLANKPTIGLASLNISKVPGFEELTRTINLSELKNLFKK